MRHCVDRDINTNCSPASLCERTDRWRRAHRADAIAWRHSEAQTRLIRTHRKRRRAVVLHSIGMGLGMSSLVTATKGPKLCQNKGSSASFCRDSARASAATVTAESSQTHNTNEKWLHSRSHSADERDDRISPDRLCYSKRTQLPLVHSRWEWSETWLQPSMHRSGCKQNCNRENADPVVSLANVRSANATRLSIFTVIFCLFPLLSGRTECGTRIYNKKSSTMYKKWCKREGWLAGWMAGWLADWLNEERVRRTKIVEKRIHFV